MVTNYPQQLTATTGTDANGDESVVNRAMSRVGQLLCGFPSLDSCRSL